MKIVPLINYNKYKEVVMALKKKQKQKFEPNITYKFPQQEITIPSNKILSPLLPLDIETAVRENRFKEFYWGRNNFLDKRLTHQLGMEDKPDGYGFPKVKKSISYRKKRNTNEFILKNTWLDNCKGKLISCKQTTCGNTLSTRSVVVADIDSLFPGIDDVLSYCDRDDIPIPTFAVLHLLTKHFQLVYLLDDPFFCPFWGLIPGYDTKEKEQYNKLIDAVNLKWEGDPRYTGSWCKNPYCDHDIKVWELGPTYSKDTLLEYFNIEEEEVVQINEQKREIRKRDDEELAKLYNLNKGKEGSRNCYTLYETIVHTFEELKKGNIPSDNEIIEFATETEERFIQSPLNIYNKTTIETPSQIRVTALSAKRFAIANFDPNKISISESRYNDEARAKSLITRSTKHISDTLLCYSMKNLNYKLKDIANLVEIGTSTVTYNLRNFKSYRLKEGLRGLRAYYRRYSYLYNKDNLTDQDKNIIKNLRRIEEVFKRLSCILSLYSKNLYSNEFIASDEILDTIEKIFNDIFYNSLDKILKRSSA